jgi:hypothetical protein
MLTCAPVTNILLHSAHCQGSNDTTIASTKRDLHVVAVGPTWEMDNKHARMVCTTSH